MKVLILCSIGTPENSTLPAVKKYLQCFLGDKRVVSIPQPFRYLLTRGIIIPHKIKHSQARYQRLASLFDGEMPLRLYLNQLKKRLQSQTDQWRIFSFMQYCGEDLKRLIEQVKAEKVVEQIVLLPLFPHQTFGSYYASLGSLPQLFARQFPQTSLHIVPPYYAHPAYIRLLQTSIKKHATPNSDLYIASFHSIPLSHQRRGVQQGFDYEVQCTQTARLLFEILPQNVERKMLFQSSIKPHRWLEPCIEKEVYNWIKEGYKRITVICPGFAIDCLETLIDIGEELRAEYLALGGEELSLVPCLNEEEAVCRLYLQLAEESLCH